MPSLKRPASAIAAAVGPEPAPERPHPAGSWEVNGRGVSWKEVWYGSDCSGLDGGAVALKRAIGTFKHWIGSEVNKSFRKVHETIHPHCEHLFHDMRQRDLSELKEMRHRSSSHPLVYTSGFPCQPYSRQGKRLGEGDDRHLVWHVLLTIADLLPDLAILENVPDLATDLRFRSLFNELLDVLTQIGNNMYFADWRILNSQDYGVPACRQRLYIVIVKKEKLVRTWFWPEVQPRVSLSSILISRAPSERRSLESLTFTALRNVSSGYQKIAAKYQANDKSWLHENWVIDCGPSEKFGVHCTLDYFPTITKSHAASLWIVAESDFARPQELLAAQGFLQSDLTVPISTLKPSTVKSMAGNAFTVNVFEQLFRGLLPAIGIRCR